MTNFPENVDSFISYINITAEDGALVKQYFLAMQAGNIAQAQQIFAQISEGSRKMVTAEGLNKMNQAITALQRFYSSDIEDYIEEKQAEWEAKFDELQYQGVYSNSTTYKKNDYVEYVVDGKTKLYIAILDPPVGTVPVNTTYWRVLTISGERGPAGNGFVFEGAWDATQTYGSQNAVVYNNYLWIALQSSTGQVPSEGSLYWERLGLFVPETYPITASRPTAQVDNALWFEIV